LTLLFWLTQARTNDDVPATQPDGPTYLQVDVVDGLTTVSARDAAIDDILAAIARKNDLSVVSEYELVERISVHFSRLPLPEALRLVLRHRSFALRHVPLEPGRNRLKQIPASTLWILDEQAQGGTRRKVPSDTESTTGSTGIEAHQVALNDPNHRLRVKAVMDLADIGGDEVIAPLTSALADDHKEVHVEAVSALADIGTEEAAALAMALSDEQTDVQEEAVWALADIGGGTSIRLLEETLGHTNKNMREAAIQGLADIGGDDSVRALGIALHDEDRSLRMGAVDALGRIGSKPAVDLLRQALADGDPLVRSAAADNLEELSEQDAPRQ
jgi:HEAT repeat protein